VVVAGTSRTIIMTLTDHGKGIPASVLENFKTSKSAVGVGLAGMRGRVADMDGKLELQSVGIGTIVRVTIPFVRGSQTAQPSSTPPPLDDIQPPSTPPKEVRGSASLNSNALNPLS